MGEVKSGGSGVVLLTEEQILSLMRSAVREELNEQRLQNEGYYDTASAAAYLKTTTRSVQHAVARGLLVPDHRGSRGGGLKGNRFSKATLDAYITRRTG